ncbi:MAG: hypothetical protein AAB116_11860 [Candidatus Poribacteria bacterium]
MKTVIFIISLIGMLFSIFLQIPEAQINSLGCGIGDISLHDGPSDPEIGLISMFMFAFSLGWCLPIKKKMALENETITKRGRLNIILELLGLIPRPNLFFSVKIRG